MRQSWRLLALAAVIDVTVGAGAVAAQTVIVRHAPPGAAVEVVLNDTVVSSAKASADGEATLPVKLTETLQKNETDGRMFIDVCEGRRRVVLVERGREPAPAGEGCARQEIPRWFAIRRVSTMVVDLSRPIPTMWLRQGPAPAEWLRDDVPGAEDQPRTWRPSPTGLVFSGGLSTAKFPSALQLACGDNAACEGDDRPIAFTAGATFWFARFVGADVAYYKAGDVTARGSGTGYSFDSSFDTHIVTVAGKGAVPIGPVRIYGSVGANYHRALFTTTETLNAVTQVLEFGATGWGWVFGGGGEVWVTPSLAIYGEAGRLKLSASDKQGGEAFIDERLTSVVVGVRIRIGL